MSNILNTTGYPQYLDHIVSAKDCYVIDENKKVYLDMEAGVWA